jgi:molybdate transport system regulatory protein
MKPTVSLQPRCKLWLCRGNVHGVFGDGKFRLLAAIHTTGSLRAAAAKLGMSYRTAWGDLAKAEKYLRLKLVERRRGGAAGGQMRVTEDGRILLKNYRCFRQAAESAVDRAFRRYLQG